MFLEKEKRRGPENKRIRGAVLFEISQEDHYSRSRRRRSSGAIQDTEAGAMNPSYESIAKWLDVYFEDVNKQQGPIETVPNLRKYFAPDTKLHSKAHRGGDEEPTKAY